MKAYKRLTEDNIVKAMGRVFTKYGNHWLPRPVITIFTMYSFQTCSLTNFDHYRITIGKVLTRQVQAGKIQSRRGKGYRLPIE